MISIIITAFRETNTIGKAIESILNQKIKEKHEIIVVAPDNETIDIAKKYKVKIIKDNNKGKPAALNLAFSKCKKSNILVLTDGDVYTSENSINELLNTFKDKKIGASSSRPVSINTKNTMLGFWSHLLTDIGAHETRTLLSKREKQIVCSGYLMAIRNIINNIPENSLADDAVISNIIYSKGYKIAYCQNSLVFVKYPTTFKDWIKQKRRSTGGYLQIKKLTKRKDEMRSFTKESLGIYRALKYPKTIKEFYWTLILILARLYLWLIIFIDIKLKRKEFSKIWQRIESTK